MVDSSQLTFLSRSKSRDSKNRTHLNKIWPEQFRHCALA